MMLFREKRQIVICIVAGAMVGGFVLFRYLPLRRRIRAAEQTKAAQALAIVKASAQSRQLPASEEQLLKLQSAVENYERRVPAHRDLGTFLHRIADLMNEHNLKEQLVQPGKEIEADVLNCIPVTIQCKGKLTQIFAFFRLLQGLDRSVRVEQVKLVNDSDFSGEVSMQTKVSIYYVPEAEQG